MGSGVMSSALRKEVVENDDTRYDCRVNGRATAVLDISIIRRRSIFSRSSSQSSRRSAPWIFPVQSNGGTLLRKTDPPVNSKLFPGGRPSSTETSAFRSIQLESIANLLRAQCPTTAKMSNGANSPGPLLASMLGPLLLLVCF